MYIKPIYQLYSAMYVPISDDFDGYVHFFERFKCYNNQMFNPSSYLVNTNEPCGSSRKLFS